MADSTFPRGEFLELVRSLAHIDVYWADKAQPSPGQAADQAQAWIELMVLSDETVGDYEYRQCANPNNPDALDSQIVAQGTITIQVRAKSFDPDVQAYDLCRRVRMGLRGMTAGAWFAANQVAFNTTHPIASFQTKAEQRWRLDANMDVVLNVVQGGDADDDHGLTIGAVDDLGTPGAVIPGTVTGD